MSDVIHLLPDNIANQIAAGEVVQRPASVIKELLENAIDAKSQEIKVVVKDAGKQLIQVIDNGVGMSVTDARMCFERHATSKIRESADLFSIRTMGFRGEALASIAAVAQVELKTRREQDELGTLICVEGSEVKKQEPVAMPVGTQISVKNLFFNVPARRNFLKSNPVELRHVFEEFNRVALAFPEVSFKIINNDLPVHDLRSGKLSKRIIDLFGKNYQKQLIPCSEDTPLLEIKGYIGKPEQAKKTKGEQYFFINNRYIRSNYLHHAVSNAYEGLIDLEEHPFYVLFIEIDPKHIDVNVHPTKHEIKFDDERTVYGLIRSAIRQALGMHNIKPSLDFSASVNLDQVTEKWKTEKPSSDYFQFRNADRRDASDWEKLFEGDNIADISIEQIRSSGEQRDEEDQQNEDQYSITLGSAANEMGPEHPSAADVKAKVIFQVAGRYIATPVRSGMLLVDQHAAHFRILYEKYMHSLNRTGAASQQLLFPRVVEMNTSDFELVKEIESELHQLGFAFEVFGKQSIIVQGLPAETGKAETDELFEAIIEQYKWNSRELVVPKKENLAKSLAKRAAVQEGIILSQPEMNHIIDELFGCENPNYAPDRKPAYVIISLDQIASFFN